MCFLRMQHIYGLRAFANVTGHSAARGDGAQKKGVKTN